MLYAGLLVLYFYKFIPFHLLVQEKRKKILFSRQQSTLIKGVAIIMLLLHHIFLFPSGNPWFTPLFCNNWGGVEFFLSSVGKLCIPVFFFVSGYGLWQASLGDCRLWRSARRRLKNIYAVYMVTVLVTLLLLFLWNGEFPLKSWRHGVETFLGTNVSINGSWWFFIIYVELLLLTPMAVRFVRKFSWQPLLLLSFFLYLFSPEVSGFTSFASAVEQIGLTSLMYKTMPLQHFWGNQLYFFTGFCLAASQGFETLLQLSCKRLASPFWRYGTALLLLAAVLLFRYFFLDIGEFFGILSWQGITIYTYTVINTRPDFILAPLFVFALCLLFTGHSLPVLSFLGHHSAAIWLIHGSILLIVLNSLKPYQPWSPLVFLAALLPCVLYALIYAGMTSLIRHFYHPQ